MDFVWPFVVFAAAMLIFAYRARREGVSAKEWIDQRNQEAFAKPDRWKPMATVVAVLAVVLLVSVGFTAAGFFAAFVWVAFGVIAIVVTDRQHRRR